MCYAIIGMRELDQWISPIVVMQMILQQLGIPLYVQVKSYILDKIKNGEYLPGAKIPTERQLAKELEISRNTVSAAYKELLLEGTLEARQGRGTFVKRHDDTSGQVAGSRMDRMLKIIDESILKVVEMGFTVDEFLAVAGIRAREKVDMIQRLRVAIVDCTDEHIETFISQIGQVANVHFEKVNLGDLLSGKISQQLLQVCDVVVTTTEHQTVVTKMLDNATKLMVVATVPNLEGAIKLAKLSPDCSIGIVAKSKDYIDTFVRMAQKIVETKFDFDVLLSEDRNTLHSFIKNHSAIVAPQQLEQLVRQLSDNGQEIIIFNYEVDQGSLNSLMSRLMAQEM